MIEPNPYPLFPTEFSQDKTHGFKDHQRSGNKGTDSTGLNAAQASPAEWFESIPGSMGNGNSSEPSGHPRNSFPPLESTSQVPSVLQNPLTSTHALLSAYRLKFILVFLGICLAAFLSLIFIVLQAQVLLVEQIADHLSENALSNQETKSLLALKGLSEKRALSVFAVATLQTSYASKMADHHLDAKEKENLYHTIQAIVESKGQLSEQYREKK